MATDSAIRVRVEAVGWDTALAGIERLVADAQRSRSRAQALADRAAAFLFYVAAAAGGLTLLGWALAGRFDNGIVRTVTVLVIACPHALGLAIPLVVSISTSLSAGSGILVKDRLALERMRTVHVVLFDKTDTLTLGEHRLTGLASVEGGEDACSRWRRRWSRTASIRWPGRSPPRASGRWTCRPPRRFAAGAGAAWRRSSPGGRSRSPEPPLLQERGLAEPASLASKLNEWRARGAAVLYVIDRAASWARWRSNTGCALSRARRWPRSASRASQWPW